MRFPRLLTLSLFAFTFSSARLSAALILNAGPNPAITQQITVQPIVVSDDDGGNTATFLGTGGQQALIEALIDQIWAQAGIDVAWLSPNFWNNTFANINTATSGVARPGSDLFQIVANGDAAGKGNANSLVIDLYFVRAAAGFQVLSVNSVAGLAFTPGNGISVSVGSALPGSDGGRDAIASVIAHEIGHNLGLPHIVEAENLMQASGSGERLNASQITAALNSSLSVPVGVPEPGTFLLLSLVLPLAIRARRLTSL